MRNWVEKLGKRMEKCGKYMDSCIIFDNIKIYLWEFSGISDYIVYIVTDEKTSQIKIYEDERDYLKDIINKVKKETENEFINMFEHYTDEAPTIPFIE